MRRRLSLALAVALVVIVTLGGAGVAQAMWSANTTATASVGSGTTGLSLAGLDQAGGQFSSSALSSGPVAVTLSNTGSLPLTISTGVTQTGTTALAGGIGVTVWDNGTNPVCPPSATGGARSFGGTWTNAALPTAPSTPLAPNSSEVFCATSSMTSANVTTFAGQSVSATLTVTGAHGGWTSSASATVGFSVAAASTPSLTDVTSTQLGITAANPGTSVAVTVTMPADAATGNQNVMPDGTLNNKNHVCVNVSVSGTSASTASDWKVAVNMSLPPFNGTPLTQGALSVGGTQTGTLASGSGTNGIYYVTGAGRISANHPLGSTASNVLYNTPLTSAQQGWFAFCVDVSLNPIVQQQGAGTYSVAGPTVGSCNNPNVLPTGPNDVCLYATVTGNYPHFEIGYAISADFSTLVKTAGLTSDVKNVLTAQQSRDPSSINWYTLSSNSAMNIGNVTKSKTGALFSLTSTGLGPGWGGVAQGQFATFKWQVNP